MRQLTLSALVLLLAGCPKTAEVSLYTPGIEQAQFFNSTLPTFGSTFVLQNPTDTQQIQNIAVLIVAVMQGCDRQHNNSCLPYAMVRYDLRTSSDVGYQFHQVGERFKTEVQALVPNQNVIINEEDHITHLNLAPPGYVLFGVVIMGER